MNNFQEIMFRMDIEIVLKITQIGFYIIGSTIAILTYLKAKNGLLNTVNTEYQKKALIKVEEISDFLISEFDEDSEFHYSKQNIEEQCVKKMLDMFKNNKEQLLKEKKWMLGVPGNPTIHRLDNWILKVKSDPFVPKTIRSLIVHHLEERVQKMLGIHVAVLRNFADSLIKNPEKYENDKDIAEVVSYEITKKQYKNGCGIKQVEENVHELRLAIQKYYERYDPFQK